MSSVIKAREGRTPAQMNTADKQAMQHYGFIYADGTYSHEREPRGAYLVPRRPSDKHMWDPDSREWYLDGEVMPPETGKVPETVGGDNAGKPPTLEEVAKANPDLAKTVPAAPVSLPGGEKSA